MWLDTTPCMAGEQQLRPSVAQTVGGLAMLWWVFLSVLPQLSARASPAMAFSSTVGDEPWVLEAEPYVRILHPAHEQIVSSDWQVTSHALFQGFLGSVCLCSLSPTLPELRLCSAFSTSLAHC